MGNVFIIGAGASMPYGFPNGFNLIQELRHMRYSNELIEKLYKTYDGNIENSLTTSGVNDKRVSIVNKWESRIKESVILTIDQFLKNHQDEPEFYEFGKMIIASLILNYEYMAKNYKKNRDGLDSIDWIQYLLTEIDTSEDWESQLMDSSFISYNYDRVLEFFIKRYLQVDKKLTAPVANDMLKKMNIYHINGYIGDLSTISFGDTKTFNFPEIAKSIRTVWDPISEESIFNEAKYKVIESRKIFIIGTSFIKENFNVIGLTRTTQVAKGKEIFATGYGLSKYQIHRAMRMIGNNVPIDSDNSLWCVRDILAVDLIQDFYCNSK